MNARPNGGELRLEPARRLVPARLGYHAARWVPVLAVALITYLAFPVAGGFDVPVTDAGKVAPRDVVAPFAFAVMKSPAEIAREGDALAATVRPIYEYKESGADTVVRDVQLLFAALDTAARGSAAAVALGFGVRLSPDEAAYLAAPDRRAAMRATLLRVVSRDLTEGVAASGVLESETSRDVVIRRAGRERMVPRASLLTFAALLERRQQGGGNTTSGVADRVLLKLLTGLFHPTLVPHRAETEAVRAELRAGVDSVKDQVRANERIVAAHEVVTAAEQDRLVALQAELLRRGGALGRTGQGIAGQVLVNALVLAVLWMSLALYRHPVYVELRQTLVLAGIFGVVVAGAAVNHQFIARGAELIPTPFAAMLITVLFGGRIALLAAAVLAVLVGSQAAYGGQDALLLALVGGGAAGLSARALRRRTQIAGVAAITAVAFALVSLTIGLRLGWSMADLSASVLRGGINAFVSAALAMMVVPIAESLAGVTTDLTLLELSDPDRPLLRRLATEAPGTYAHSVAMANLCETACEAIGANGLLARVGCYYHDIGKLAQPQFFVENQGPAGNPHDRLSPEASAAIIRGHVKEGLALAQQHRVPAAVAAFIPEHHGTGEISYFLDRARGSGNVVPDSFRYPGPRPKSAETAIALLGDGVEAALRVLDDPTPERLRDAIDHICEQRMSAGQLDDAPLTLAQLNQIKREFLRVLTGMYHSRIDYPASGGGLSAAWYAAGA
jgi:hypothetical protein